MRVARSLEGSISYKQMMFLFNLLNHRVRSLERSIVAPRSGKCTQADSDCDEDWSVSWIAWKLFFFLNPWQIHHIRSLNQCADSVFFREIGGVVGVPQFSLIWFHSELQKIPSPESSLIKLCILVLKCVISRDMFCQKEKVTSRSQQTLHDETQGESIQNLNAELSREAFCRDVQSITACIRQYVLILW